MPNSIETVGDILDRGAPAIGDNSKKADLAELLPEETAKFREDADKLIASAGRAAITNEETAGKVTLLGKMIAEHMKTVDAAREERKKPFLESGRLVDSHFKAITDPLATAKKKLADMLTVWLRKKEAEAAEARRKADAEARARTAEANTAAALAAVSGDVESEAGAAQAQAVATQAVEQAQAVAAAPVMVDSGLGAKSSGTTRPVVTITDLRAAVLHLIVTNEPEVRAFVQTHYDRQARAKIRNLPGADVREEKFASIR